jgi:3-phenylpropionate/trans-cinnamate dioxygenase ferredoxin reductase subunit
MKTRPTTLIAGAGLAGSRTAESLRACGYDGRILLVGAETHPPYERPALSKELLAGTRADVALRSDCFWEDHEIELVLGRLVESIDPERRSASIDGERIDWDSLVLATGVQPRRLDGPAGVHHLRTLDDAIAIREELDADTRVVVVGAGFIGGEVASTLVGRVGSVTVVEAQAVPLERILGADVGAILAARHRVHGVDLRLGVGVEDFDGNEHLERVRLTDGDVIDADIAVVGIGSVGEAVEVDTCGRSSTPAVYACGDVAAWWRPSEGRHVRTEHWTSAAGQARAVGAAIAGDATPYDEPSFFWSDQFGLRLQYVGHADAWSAVVLDGDEDAFTARYLGREDELLAALAVNSTGLLAGLRKELVA